MPGVTAWAGLLQIGQPKPGETVVVSAAAGAVGSVVGQIAKLRGCRAVGIAGGPHKCRHVVEDLGFDACVDYKSRAFTEELKAAVPAGVDVYFDNVGGESLEAALDTLRLHGRIIACGGISGYNEEKPKPGPSNLFNMTTKRLTMKGLIVGDWLDRQSEFEKEVGTHYQGGKLKSLETVVVGLDQAADAFIGLFDGKNVGKMVIKLSA
jgi:NADPH-dependent curcumin reductase CurA